MLKEMGFSDAIIKKAWDRSDIKTPEGLINWIEQNPEI